MKNYIDAAMLLLAKGGGGSADAVARLRRDVDLLYRLTEGDIWDVQTDSQAAYTKTVPSGAVAAEIGSIGGKTVKRNQMVPNGNFATKSGWALFTDESGTFEVSENTGVYTASDSEVAQQGIKSTFSLDKEHRYFAHVEVKRSAQCAMYATLSPDSINSNRISVFSNSELTGTWEIGEAVFASLDAQTATGMRITSYGTKVPSGETVSVRNCMVFDLTELFGTDYSKTIIAEVKADLADIGISMDAYIPTSEPVPVSAAVTSIVSKNSDAETLGTIEIPAAVRALEGYGESEVGGSGNTLNLSAGTYTEIGHYVDGIWTPLDTPVTVDVSGVLPDNMLDAEAGGTLTFVQEATQLPVPNSVDYLIKLSEVTV